MRRRNSTNETECTERDEEENKSQLYDNISGMAMTHTATQSTDRGNEEVALYSTVQPATNSNQEDIIYATVQKPRPQSEDDIQYVGIRFPRSGAAPRSPVQRREDDSVIYSTVSKHT
ncbi:hypothetical protein AAFF_G00377180 [Aldrovandia affinis]|uniref:Uncharacterized protein n=1 Tax=Aldrovandia affinis TaxID=143900 RepID=A0AAD7SFP7_9TELE|nr:hypothetical protein AAFF_G00377180 [Aldrovandia affinis]